MSIIRNAPGPEEHFQLLSNSFARDSRVKPRSARVYIYLRSHRTGWSTNVRRVAEALKMNPETVNNAINDLEYLGYVERRQTVNEAGKFMGVEYVTYAEAPDPETPETVDPETPETAGNPGSDRVPETRIRKNRTRKNRTRKNRTYKKTNNNKTNFKKTTNTPPSESGGVVAAPPQPDSADEFEAFWKKYPRRKGTSKQDARRKYAQAIKDGARPEQLGAALEEQKTMWANEQREVTKIPHAATWLNQRRWEDADDNWNVQAAGPKSGNPFLDLIHGDADVW